MIIVLILIATFYSILFFKKRKRRRLLTLLKNRFIKRNCGVGLCSTVDLLAQEELISIEEFVYLNTYLEKERPTSKKNSIFCVPATYLGYWWPTENSEIRIQFLDYLINKNL